MNLYDIMFARRSVRQFTGVAVPEDAIRRILEAARQAPSACNIQPWHFYVVRDAETRRRLFPQERQHWAAEAPVVLVACSRPGDAWVRRYDEKNHADVDLGIVVEHLILAATAEGLGACWICAFDPANARAVLDLPAELEPVAMTPLGYAAETPPQRPRKAMAEITTWIG